MSGWCIAFIAATSRELKASSPFFMSSRRCAVRLALMVMVDILGLLFLVGDALVHASGLPWRYVLGRESRRPVLNEYENPPFEAAYRFVSPSSFASSASSILTGRSLGRVQFLKRCGTTA